MVQVGPQFQTKDCIVINAVILFFRQKGEKFTMSEAKGSPSAALSIWQGGPDLEPYRVLVNRTKTL